MKLAINFKCVLMVKERNLVFDTLAVMQAISPVMDKLSAVREHCPPPASSTWKSYGRQIL